MEAEILYEWSTIGTTAKSGDEGMGGGGNNLFFGEDGGNLLEYR